MCHRHAHTRCRRSSVGGVTDVIDPTDPTDATDPLDPVDPLAPADPLDPLDAVVVGSRTVVPDASRPVAAVLEGERFVRWITWPDAVLPSRAVDRAEFRPSPTGAWVVYVAEGIDLAERTAVFLTPEGVSCSVDLGDRRPIGDDADGLWIGDPRDASTWTRAVDGHDDHDADEAAAGMDTIDPETLEWAPAGPFWPDRDTWTEPDEDDHDHDHEDDPDGDTDDDLDDPSVVMTASQWSFRVGHPWEDAGVDDPDGEPEHEPAPEDAPDVPQDTPPTEVVRIGHDGIRTPVQVDHLVDAVRVEGDRMTLRFHPTGPRLLAATYGGWDTHYEPREVHVDVSDGLPASVTTADLPSTPVVEDTDGDAWAADEEELDARRTPFVGRFDLSGVAGASWQMVEPAAEAVAASTAALRDAFTGLGDPGVVWTADSDEPRRSRSAHRAVEVTVEGTWPDTEVVVSFEHTDVPFLRLRRRYRVFDASGRPNDWGYVTVYLEEDIATGDIPPRSAAVDGVLDI